MDSELVILVHSSYFTIIEEISSNMDARQQIDLILSDFSTLLSVPHYHLVKKLKY